MGRILAGLLFLAPAVPEIRGGVATSDLWQEDSGGNSTSRWEVKSRSPVERGRRYRLQEGLLRQALDRAPREFTAGALDQIEILTLPMPDGTTARFQIWESPVLHPDLAAKFPEIRTFGGRGVDDSSAVGRFDWTPDGFHGQIISPGGRVRIDPIRRGDTSTYTSYYSREASAEQKLFECYLEESGHAAGGSGGGVFDPITTGAQLRTYRLAMACTGEYAQFHGGTMLGAMSAIATTVNRVVGIYMLELSIRLELVADNDQLIFLNSATDPYTNSDGIAMMSQNQTTADSVIGIGGYDVGHVLSSTSGGYASLGVVCTSGKARGVSGSSSPAGDPFDVDFLAHELGHQFGARHTFNGDSGSCSGSARDAAVAFEPGSGSTIMGYAGICNNDDLQAHSDPYFHSASHDEIENFLTSGNGANCGNVTSTGNHPPVVDAGDDYTIPHSTPFSLTAVGGDTDVNDVLSYNWEQRDLGPAADAQAPDDGQIPLFRSWSPTSSPTRYFPRLPDLLNNSTVIGEQLPSTTRLMVFRASVRDQQAGGGGYASDDMQITVDGSAGPFRVLFPNDAETIAGIQTVLWEEAGTSGGSIQATEVNILLSTDSGQSFPYVLIAGAPNTGSAEIVLPNISNTTARILVEAADNIFFDVSDQDFRINLADDMAITPDTPQIGQGVEGGPFSPDCAVYTIVNIGGEDLAWSLSSAASWIALGESNGVVQSGTSAFVDICIGADAETLGPGTHEAEVYFTNETSGFLEERILQLTVTPIGGILRFQNDLSQVQEDAGSVILSIERVGSTEGAVGVVCETSDSNSTAVAGQDYTPASSVLVWGHGYGGTRQIVVPLHEDTLVESTELFHAVLRNPTGGAGLGQTAIATVMISDNDNNDVCTDSSSMYSMPFSANQSTLGNFTSANDPIPSCAAGFTNGVWYSYTPASSGLLSVDTEGSDFNTLLAVYSGPCNALEEIGCNDDVPSGLTSRVNCGVESGQTYFILAGGSGGEAGQLQLNADLVLLRMSGENDICSNAVVIASTPFLDLRDTTVASTAGDPNVSCVTDLGNGVWYEFTPESDGAILIDTDGSSFDTGIAVFSGDCGNLNEVSCDDDAGDKLTSQIIYTVDSGTTYYILAGGFKGDSGSLTFALEFMPSDCFNWVLDGGFELGTPWTAWTFQSSLASGSPICDLATCSAGSVRGPKTGSNWINFSHPDGIYFQIAEVGQTVTIPFGAVSASLSFHLWISEVGGVRTDTLEVLVDSTVVATYTEPGLADPVYLLRTIDLNPFANGLPHAIIFRYTGQLLGGIAAFQVDNIVVQACLPPDFDGDGIEDDVDPDDDNDDMPDEWELLHNLDPYNTSDAQGDNDLDRRLNIEEYVADTIPTNALSYLSLMMEPRVSPTVQPLSFESSTNREYYLDYRPDAVAGSWISVITNTPGVGGTMNVDVTNNESVVIFRLGVEVP